MISRRPTQPTTKTMEYLTSLEDRLSKRSNYLEDLHFEAAIDAELTSVPQNRKAQVKDSPIFDDYVNPHSVSNCLSPYVPSEGKRLAACLDFTDLSGGDNRESAVLMDLGCGDGRVCIAATKISGCRSVGLDVSPACIQMARDVAREELKEKQTMCSFYDCDATSDPNELLNGMWPRFPHQARTYPLTNQPLFICSKGATSRWEETFGRPLSYFSTHTRLCSASLRLC